MAHRPADFVPMIILAMGSLIMGGVLWMQIAGGVAYGKAGSHPTYLADDPIHFWISMGFQFVIFAMLLSAAIFLFIKVRKL
jgi:hypothetical protein